MANERHLQREGKEHPQPGGAQAPGQTTGSPQAGYSGSGTQAQEGSSEGSAERARKEAEQTAKQAREQAKGVAAHASERARGLGHEVGEQVRSIVDSQQRMLVSEAQAFAQALHAASDELEKHDHRMLARNVDWAASNLGSWTDALDQRDLGGLLDEVSGFARRQPGLFIGGTIAAGFLLGRFLQSSSERGREDVHGRPASRQTQPATTAGPYGTPTAPAGHDGPPQAPAGNLGGQR